MLLNVRNIPSFEVSRTLRVKDTGRRERLPTAACCSPQNGANIDYLLNCARKKPSLPTRWEGSPRSSQPRHFVRYSTQVLTSQATNDPVGVGARRRSATCRPNTSEPSHRSKSAFSRTAGIRSSFRFPRLPLSSRLPQYAVAAANIIRPRIRQNTLTERELLSRPQTPQLPWPLKWRRSPILPANSCSESLEVCAHSSRQDLLQMASRPVHVKDR